MGRVINLLNSPIIGKKSSFAFVSLLTGLGIRDQERLKELKDCGEEIGKNCLFGGYSVYNAIERGYFERPAGIFKGERLQSGEKVSHVDQLQSKKIIRYVKLDYTKLGLQ